MAIPPPLKSVIKHSSEDHSHAYFGIWRAGISLSLLRNRHLHHSVNAVELPGNQRDTRKWLCLVTLQREIATRSCLFFSSAPRNLFYPQKTNILLHAKLITFIDECKFKVKFANKLKLQTNLQLS